MARIVYITNGMASTLNSSLELSRRLRDSGHELVYLSHEDVGAAVDREGYDFIRLSRDREIREQIDEGTTREKRLRLRQASLDNREIEERLNDLQPDLLLIDMEMHFAIIATASLGIPTLLINVFFTVYRAPGVPPLHTSMQPAESSFGRFTIALAWWRARAGAFLLSSKRRLGHLMRGERLRPVLYGAYETDDLEALARTRGFDLRAETDRSHWLRPFAYRNMPIACLNALEMDMPHEARANMTYVGPMVRRHQGQAMLGERDARRWESFRQKRQEAGTGRPLVYCSLGTFWSADRPFLRQILEVFDKRQDWDLVLGLGGRLAPEELGPTSSNVLALEFAPQIEVLQVASCAVTHGGVTSLNECVYFEVPMVVYSTGHVDQNGNAARVALHGLGIVPNRDATDARRLERDIESALDDQSIAESIGQMRQRLLAYERAGSAVELVESHLHHDPVGAAG